MATLFLIHGFVGSGKTTFAKTLETDKNAIRFSPDEWMAHFYGNNPPAELFSEYDTRIKAMISRHAREFVRRGHDVVLDYGFWRRADRDEYRALARGWGVDCVLYALDSDFERCRQRVLQRTSEMPEGALHIDEHALSTFWGRFEPIEADEDFIRVEASLSRGRDPAT